MPGEHAILKLYPQPGFMFTLRLSCPGWLQTNVPPASQVQGPHLCTPDTGTKRLLAEEKRVKKLVPVHLE